MGVLQSMMLVIISIFTYIIFFTIILYFVFAITSWSENGKVKHKQLEEMITYYLNLFGVGGR